MNAVGIDVSKGKSMIAVTRPFGEVVSKPFAIRHTSSELRELADYGLDNWVELREHTPMDTIRYQLKTMNRQYGLYTKNKTAMKNNLIALLDQTFPGVNTLFSSPTREDGSQKWVDFATSFHVWGWQLSRSTAHG